MKKHEKVKEAVRARDGFRCLDCGMTAEEHRQWCGRTLDVHRLVPGSPYSPKGCVTVCKRCHVHRHHPPRRNSNGLRIMVRIPRPLVERLKILAERNVTNHTQEAIRAIREYLERQGLWPPRES